MSNIITSNASPRLVSFTTLEGTGIRFVGFAGDIRRFRWCGFSADIRGNTIYRPLVARLRARGGVSHFVPGYQVSGSEVIVLDLSHPKAFAEKQSGEVRMCQAARTAADAADAMADREARKQRHRERARTCLRLGLHEMRIRMAA